MADTIDKNTLYEGLDVPPLVAAAVALARQNDFPFSCTPAQGRLLQVLAAGREGGRIAETGTGYGAGVAWMLTAVTANTELLSVEADGERAEASRELFTDHDNVTILHGDWREIVPFAPFDLLVLDGGGGGKREDDPPADPTALLVPGGSVVLDDFHPPAEGWPPAVQAGYDAYGRELDRAREYWFNHPDLLTTEFRVHPVASTIVGMRRGDAGDG
ncbi:MAG: class I SAM-dependent methyltransferase [Alphaproteobacteria bacterium]|jgi:predicted O-methyltransferase YrrM|nr:SAM-dependent methyltransferase [Rhodospirillaceae bacterium]MDP6404950.1 class I SAM-dependent methyltransferase [Alphaproteobacteria bacterium]|tara:strand:+ start:328 stop:975 length:648 start_codon:yes stop_codon:yes gene_type:complete